MKLEYIGSAQDLVNCNSIRLIDSVGALLNIEDIHSYVIDNVSIPLFIRATAVNPNRVNDVVRFEIDINESTLTEGSILDFEYNPKQFNYIIFDDDTGNPIGYLKLDQTYNWLEHSFEKIVIQIEFNVSTSTAEVDFNIVYSDHISDTVDGIAHSLAQSRGQVARKSELEGYQGNQLFTRNIKQVISNPDLIYRYSGKLYKYDSTFNKAQFKIDDSNLGSSKFIELIRQDHLIYLLIVYNDKVKVHCVNSDNLSIVYQPYELNIIIHNRYHIGSNIIIGEYDGHEVLFNTSDLLKQVPSQVVIKPINKFSRSINSNYSPIKLTTQSGSVYLPCKNPIDKSIEIYNVDRNSGKITALSNRLRKLLLNFELDILPNNFELVYATNSSIILRKIILDSANPIATNCEYYLLTHQLNYTITQNDVIEQSSEYFNEDGSRKLSILDNLKDDAIQFITEKLICIEEKIPDIRQSLVHCIADQTEQEILDRTSMDDPGDSELMSNVIYFSSDVDYNKKYSLIELSEDLEHSYRSQSIIPKLRVSKLFGKSGILNLYKVIKNVSDLNFSLLNISLDGSLLGYSRVTDSTTGENKIIIRKL